MWRPRLIESARTKYLGIVEALEADIRSMEVSWGDRLPPQRAIAEDLNVDVTTVTRAFNEARRRGLVEARAGRGTFISEKFNGNEPSEQAGALVDFSMNVPPQPSESDFRRMFPRGIAGILSSPRALSRMHYQDSQGAEADRFAAAAWLTQRIKGARPDRIVVTGGAQCALFAICNLLLARGDVILAGAMTYPGLKAIAARKGLVLEPLTMDQQGIVPDGFERVCREKSPKALYLIPTIDNPTTATMPEDRRREIAAIARKHGVAMIEDDPYAPLRPERIVTVAELASDITWHVATLSKCATPALRVAYVVAPNGEMALRLAGVLRATILTAPPMMSALATRWIADGTLDQVAKAIGAQNAVRQRLAASILRDVSFAADPHGPHLWLNLPGHWRPGDFAAYAGRVGVSIVPGSAFAVETHSIGAVRISLGVAPDRNALEDGLTELASLMAQPSLGTRAVV
jgi:DNA-binding transcriptional MocR family regulator